MFEIYKKGQGYWTRMLTMLGSGLVVLLGAYWLYQRPLFRLANWLRMGEGYGTMLRAFGSAVFILAGGYLAFWVSYLKPSTGDFFIATEGEMKKVSWSSRQEIIGSTKVVIFTLLAMGILLFVVDLLFMLLFSALGVLQIASIRELFLGPAGGT